eukprot:3936811-Pyramimonas_sp.AAC.2
MPINRHRQGFFVRFGNLTNLICRQRGERAAQDSNELGPPALAPHTAEADPFCLGKRKRVADRAPSRGEGRGRRPRRRIFIELVDSPSSHIHPNAQPS